jgi:hypothetical protein
MRLVVRRQTVAAAILIASEKYGLH